MPATCPCPGLLCGQTTPRTCVDGVQLTPFAEVMFLTGPAPTRTPICTTNVMTAPLCRMGAGGSQSPGLYLSSGVGGTCTTDCDAVLKSLQIGIGGEPSSGHKIVAEVLDQRGGSLQAWFEKLVNPRLNPRTVFKMVCRFGWVTKGAGGGAGGGCEAAMGGTGTSLISSGLIYTMPRDMNIKFENGKIKFDIEGTDTMEWLNQSRQEDVIGSQTQKVSLKSALDRFLKDRLGMEWEGKELDANGNPQTMRFKKSGGTPSEEGPEDVWPCNMNNALGTVQEWLRGVTTSNNKGIFITTDSSSEKPKILLWEDTQRFRCDQPDRCRIGRILELDKRTGKIAHYIVNGGNNSPVLSFTPQIAWNLQSTGSTVRTTQGTRSPAPTQPCPGFGTGPEVHVGVSSTGINQHGPNNYAEGMRKAIEAHIAANRTQFPIEAELKVQGEPGINSQLCFVGKYVSLVVYGAAYAKKDPSGCPIWSGLNTTGSLNGSPCVDFLSSPDWLVTGVDHSIRDGSFHTSFKLRLIRHSPAAQVPCPGTGTP